MRLSLPTILLLSLAACSPPVMFSVSVDEPVEGGRLVLNGRSADLMQNVDGNYWAKWDGADAHGQIEIQYPDGTMTACEIGYVTNGLQNVQQFAVTDRTCEWMSG